MTEAVYTRESISAHLAKVLKFSTSNRTALLKDGINAYIQHRNRDQRIPFSRYDWWQSRHPAMIPFASWDAWQVDQELDFWALLYDWVRACHKYSYEECFWSVFESVFGSEEIIGLEKIRKPSSFKSKKKQDCFEALKRFAPRKQWGSEKYDRLYKQLNLFRNKDSGLYVILKKDSEGVVSVYDTGHSNHYIARARTERLNKQHPSAEFELVAQSRARKMGFTDDDMGTTLKSFITLLENGGEGCDDDIRPLHKIN